MLSPASFVRDNLLPLSIALGLVLAWLWPGGGRVVHGLDLTGPMVGLVFLCQGFLWRPVRGLAWGGLAGIFLWGLVVNQVLGPLLGLAGAWVCPGPADLGLGLVLMSAMPPTLVSGALLAARAGGDAGVAMLLAVGLNISAVFTLPPLISLLLGPEAGASAGLEPGPLFLKLVILVLLPAGAGHLLSRMPHPPRAAAGFVRLAPLGAMVAIIWESAATHAARIAGLGWDQLILLAALALGVHLATLASSWWLGLRAWRLEPARAMSVAVVASQKTLPLPVVIWSLALAASHPLAILTPLVFHPLQILFDALILAFHHGRKSGPSPSPQ